MTPKELAEKIFSLLNINSAEARSKSMQANFDAVEAELSSALEAERAASYEAGQMYVSKNMREYGMKEAYEDAAKIVELHMPDCDGNDCTYIAEKIRQKAAEAGK